jgi:nucleoside 2-deoxyribosyltransferase
MTTLKYDVYLAGPLFNDEQIKSCETIENFCLQNKIHFFAPRLSTKEEGKTLGSISKELRDTKIDDIAYKQTLLAKRDAAADAILNANKEAIDASLFMLANIDDRDPGTMFEIGYAVARGIPVVTYSFKHYGSNIMISQSVVSHVDAIDWEQQEELHQVVMPLVNELRNYDASDMDFAEDPIKVLRSKYYIKKDLFLE